MRCKQRGYDLQGERKPVAQPGDDCCVGRLRGDPGVSAGDQREFRGEQLQPCCLA